MLTKNKAVLVSIIAALIACFIFAFAINVFASESDTPRSGSLSSLSKISVNRAVRTSPSMRVFGTTGSAASNSSSGADIMVPLNSRMGAFVNLGGGDFLNEEDAMYSDEYRAVLGINLAL